MKCPTCEVDMVEGRRYTWEEDLFDLERAIECGFDPKRDNELADEWLEFAYILDRYECPECGEFFDDEDGQRYYFDPERCDYSALPPMTPAEQAAFERHHQERCGQQRMFQDKSLYP